MQFTVSARHMELTDGLRDHVLARMEHDLREFPRVESARVILDVVKHDHHAEIVVTAKNHVHIEAEHACGDMYVSIDEAVGKAARQLRKLRDRVVDHKHATKLGELEVEAARNGAAPSDIPEV